MPIRSGVLAKAISPGAGLATTIATVPATTTWLIKSVVIFNNAAGVGMTGVSLVDPTSIFIGTLIDETIPNPSVKIVQGTFALMPGGTILVNWQSASEYVWISGTQLPGSI